MGCMVHLVVWDPRHEGCKVHLLLDFIGCTIHLVSWGPWLCLLLMVSPPWLSRSLPSPSSMVSPPQLLRSPPLLLSSCVAHPCWVPNFACVESLHRIHLCLPSQTYLTCLYFFDIFSKVASLGIAVFMWVPSWPTIFGSVKSFFLVLFPWVVCFPLPRSSKILSQARLLSLTSSCWFPIPFTQGEGSRFFSKWSFFECL